MFSLTDAAAANLRLPRFGLTFCGCFLPRVEATLLSVLSEVFSIESICNCEFFNFFLVGRSVATVETWTASGEDSSTPTGEDSAAAAAIFRAAGVIGFAAALVAALIDCLFKTEGVFGVGAFFFSPRFLKGVTRALPVEGRDRKVRRPTIVENFRKKSI